jgi:4-alpha-glucanotransferase
MRPLDELARRHGIQTTHRDRSGRPRRAPDQTVVAVLRALGVGIRRPEDAVDSLRTGPGGAGAGAVVDPVLVSRAGAVRAHAITLPSTVDPARVGVTLRREDGEEVRTALADLLVASGGAASNERHAGSVVQRRFRLPDLPDGYHRLVVEGPRRRAEALVVAAPGRCPQPGRGWGVLAPLTSLRTAGDWGVGTYRDLAALGEWVGGLGGTFVGTLPLFASFLEGPLADPSPYRPASRLAWNELYVDVEALPGLERCAEARRVLHAGAGLRARSGRHASVVADPVATMAAKRCVLEPLAADAVADVGARRQLDAFVSSHPAVLAYAQFRAACERDPGATPRRRLGRTGVADPRVRYHLYAQWVADAQLAAAAGRGLYLDLPVGVHPRGFDPWWRPGAFVGGVSSGSPPDDFFARGQVWGLNPPHPSGQRAEGYEYLATTLRFAMRHASVVRIDHVMGLHRLWFVPDGMDATDGVYVRYPHEELRAVVVLEASRAGAAVVGEDLGTVPAEVRRAMRRDGMLRSSVYQFEATPRCPFPEIPPDALASLGTHDLPTFAAWWSGDDIEDRRRRGLTRPAEASAERDRRRALRAAVSRIIGRRSPTGRTGGGSRGSAATRRGATGVVTCDRALRACLEHLASSRAPLVTVDPPDLWGERQPLNRPGTGGDEPNFRRRWAKAWPADLVSQGRRAPSATLRLVDRARRGASFGGKVNR